MRFQRPVLWLTLCTLLGCLPACRPAPTSAPIPAPMATPLSDAKTYTGQGVIQGFQSEEKVIILKHQAIPGLMEGMTMGFELKDPTLAHGFKVGDAVTFELTVKGDDWTVTGLKKK